MGLDQNLQYKLCVYEKNEFIKEQVFAGYSFIPNEFIPIELVFDVLKWKNVYEIDDFFITSKEDLDEDIFKEFIEYLRKINSNPLVDFTKDIEILETLCKDENIMQRGYFSYYSY